MFSLNKTSINGCWEIQPRVLEDSRGSFVKVFNKGAFSDLGLETEFYEEYYSHSHKDVIRGLHFQTPPADHVKIVYCLQGAVFDVVLDLRNGSPTYGKFETFKLNAESGNFLYIPKGLAHGFCATSDSATLVYKVSSGYAPEHDHGILWSSLDIQWPSSSPIVSSRDASFLPMSKFASPFYYDI